MKDIFVVGFSPAVKSMLQTFFAIHIQSGAISWIADGEGPGADLSRFKEVFQSRLDVRRPTEVLVIFAIPAENRWLLPQLEKMLGEARSRYPHSTIGLDEYRDFGAAVQIKNRIEAFALPGPELMSLETVRHKLGGERVICIVAAGRPSILVALARAGVPEDAINTFFDEEVIETGRNSTLMEHLQKFVKQYGHMLYAWGTLRTSSKGLVQGFKRKGVFFEAESAGKVSELMRRFLSQND